MNALANVTPLRPPTPTADYLSPAQVCELIPGVTVANLKDMRSSGKGPAYCKPTGDAGRVVVYRRADVVEWVERSRRTTTEQS